MVASSIRPQDVLLSGGAGHPVNSARAGFLPVPLDRAPLGAFDGIAVYMKVTGAGAGGLRPTDGVAGQQFLLYSAATVPFSAVHRARLQAQGVRFVYIAMANHARLQAQTEACLEQLATDPSVSLAGKCEIIYETSVELVNELLAEPDMAAHSPRLAAMSRAVTTLVLNDPKAFQQLFAASHHDFYTATHMVNVGTWMVPLAYALGIHDPQELSLICEAGIVHDIGKIYVAEEILNKKGRLTDAEWVAIKKHPELGAEHLRRGEGVAEMVLRVTLEHHERMDGTGYPAGLKGDQMHRISKICAVVDSFDAMTAFRPFKDKTTSVAAALEILTKESPQKYDAEIVHAWVELMRKAADERPQLSGIEEPPGLVNHGAGGEDSEKGRTGRRAFPRYPINCPAELLVLKGPANGAADANGMKGVAHSVSAAGVGILLSEPVAVGEQVRVTLRGGGTLNQTMAGLSVRCRSYRDGYYDVGISKLEAAVHAGGEASVGKRASL